MKKLYCITCGNYRKFKNPKLSYFFEKTLVLSIICSNCENEDEKYIKKNNQFRHLKILDLFKNI